jgi:lysophospholipase L1-like esterase
MIMRRMAAAGLMMAACMVGTARAEERGSWKFSFMGEGIVPTGTIVVAPDVRYSDAAGYGFEENVNIPAPGIAPMPATAPAIERTGPIEVGALTSKERFLFSAKVPEGNYRVTVTLGDPLAESTTTVKAEARRLMLERVQVPKGGQVTRSFCVNVRRPEIAGKGGKVQLDPREPGSLTWDDKLTLEFCDTHPALQRLEIERAEDVATVFLCSDSTVTDQPREPYGTWGQMLPRFFNDKVAIANNAESGETLKAFTFEKRWDKVMSQVKKGDYVFLQFGHNDLNKSGRNAMWPAEEPSGDWSKTYSEAQTDYKRLLKEYAAQVKEKGATAVIVSPMTKIAIGTGELNIAGLRDYPQAAVEAAKEAGVPLIDLNAMSIEVMKGLGPEMARRASVDGLHSNSYGGYLLARCVVEGIRGNSLELARELAADAGKFDPGHPSPTVDDFKVPLEPAPRFGFGRGRGRGAGRDGRGQVGAPATAPAGSGNR